MRWKINLVLCLSLPLPLISLSPAFAEQNSNECVVLLHGLARTSSSMEKIADRLSGEGYQTVNYDYPSRDFNIAELAQQVIPAALAACRQSQKIHFVTHSLGGILIRYYLRDQRIKNLGRIVMLSPPNQGSEVVDKLADVPGYDVLNGPAGRQLGTDQASIPLSLPAADFELGIITGNKSINPILSQLIPGEDDGKVSVERAKLLGMQDFLVVPHSHTFIMRNDKVIQQILYFLPNGEFDQRIKF